MFTCPLCPPDLPKTTGVDRSKKVTTTSLSIAHGRNILEVPSFRLRPSPLLPSHGTTKTAASQKSNSTLSALYVSNGS